MTVESIFENIIVQRDVCYENYINEIVAYGTLTQEQFDKEIMKGIEDINEGRTFTAEEVASEMKSDYGVGV